MASLNPSNSVGVLIHGCHLQAEEWEFIVFGKQDRLGRVPTGIEEAINGQAALIFWGTGASQSSNGLKESEYIYQQATRPKLQELAWHVKKEPSALLDYLSRVSFIDKKSQNTTQEVAAAVIECQSRGIQELILVSSPTHIARCLQEACMFKEQNPNISIKFYARASDTCYAHSTAADVTIVEPPHRGDRPKVPFNKTVAGIFQFLRSSEIAFAFNNVLTELIAKYKKELEEKDKA